MKLFNVCGNEINSSPSALLISSFFTWTILLFLIAHINALIDPIAKLLQVNTFRTFVAQHLVLHVDPIASFHFSAQIKTIVQRNSNNCLYKFSAISSSCRVDWICVHVCKKESIHIVKAENCLESRRNVKALRLSNPPTAMLLESKTHKHVFFL